MIGYRMPIFQDGSMLTKEMLEQLKYFSVTLGDLTFANYADGIISGGEITGDRAIVNIDRCMIKYGQYVLFIPDRTSITLQSTSNLQVVKLVVRDIEKGSSFESIPIEIQIEQDKEDSKNGIELFRVQMQDGARLRSQYVDFFDMNTRFDTLNLIHSQWAAYGEQSIHPKILEQFYREAIACHGKEMVDHAFLMQIGNLQGRACERKLIEYYLDEKIGHSAKRRTNEEIYKDLCKALREMKNVRKQVTEKKIERRMIVD